MKNEGKDSFDRGMLQTIQLLTNAVSILFVGMILLTLVFAFNEDLMTFFNRVTTPRPKVNAPDEVPRLVNFLKKPRNPTQQYF